MKSLALCIFSVALSLLPAAAAQEVIPLYPGNAPGSSQESHPEKRYFSKAWNTEVVTNVTRPTLTVFKPSPELKNGTGIVICPGGGFMALSIASEGTDLAQYLTAKGVTAFVLKYRVAPTEGDATAEFQKLWSSDRAKLSEMLKSAEPLAFADGLAAVTYVRQHASQWGISPDRVGIVGFSAGGGVTASVAFHYSADSRPAFVAPIYMGGFRTDDPVPADAPPMFVAAATDDSLGLAPQSVGIYEKWTAAHKSAELHMYAKGGHGFGMRTQHLPSDEWINQFVDWLRFEGFLSK